MSVPTGREESATGRETKSVGFSCKPYQISDLAGYFRKARLDGFNVLRMADASILLMFDDEGKRKRKEIMESGVL
ncbi:hypothetical protein V6N13_047227 [Hibiscus sabdariffa]